MNYSTGDSTLICGQPRKTNTPIIWPFMEAYTIMCCRISIHIHAGITGVTQPCLECYQIVFWYERKHPVLFFTPYCFLYLTNHHIQSLLAKFYWLVEAKWCWLRGSNFSTPSPMYLFIINLTKTSRKNDSTLLPGHRIPGDFYGRNLSTARRNFVWLPYLASYLPVNVN